MSTVNDFISNFTSGARSNLYKVIIDGIDQKLEFVCKAAQIPGKTINPIEMNYLNNQIKIAGDTTFEDWSITVVNDEDFGIRQQLDEWQENIKNNAAAVGQGNLSDYFRTATVIQLNRDGSENANGKYKFQALWPTSVEPIDLGFDNRDTVEEYGVTFSYAYWEKE
jgi:hypothetical protein